MTLDLEEIAATEKWPHDPHCGCAVCDPYFVTCARCKRSLLNTEAIVEEGDEWECPECNKRENARERRLADNGSGSPAK